MRRTIVITSGLVAVALTALVVFASSSFNGAREGGEQSAHPIAGAVVGATASPAAAAASAPGAALDSDVISKAVPASKPTHTPAPSATPEPTHTPAPSATPQPTHTPAPVPTRPPTEYARACGPAFFNPILEPPRPALDWTRDGARILFSALDAIYLVDSVGSRLRSITGSLKRPATEDNPGMELGLYAEASPDGSRIVYATCEYATEDTYRDEVSLYHFPDYRDDFLSYDYEVAVINTDGSNRGRLTQNLDIDHYPAWSPDGNAIAFISNEYDDLDRYYKGGLKLTKPDGTGVRNLHRAAFYPPQWSPDGERIAFVGSLGSRSRRVGTRVYAAHALYVITADGLLIRDLADVAGAPSWSPDGHRLAFIAASNSEDDGLFALELHTISESGEDVRKISEIDDKFGMIHGTGVSGVSWSPGDLGFIVTTLQGGPGTEVFVIGNDGSEFQRLENSYAEWSPDGTRIAVVAWYGYVGYTRTKPTDNVWLYTVAPDGSDRRDLVIIGDDGEPRAANPK